VISSHCSEYQCEKIEATAGKRRSYSTSRDTPIKDADIVHESVGNGCIIFYLANSQQVHRPGTGVRIVLGNPLPVVKGDHLGHLSLFSPTLKILSACNLPCLIACNTWQKIKIHFFMMARKTQHIMAWTSIGKAPPIVLRFGRQGGLTLTKKLLTCMMHRPRLAHAQLGL